MGPRKRRRAPAFTLLETAIVVAVVVLLASAGAALALAAHPLAVRDAEDRMARLLDTARRVAATTGDGATIVVLAPPAGGAGFVATLYRHRPMPGTPLAIAGSESYVSPVRIGLEGPATAPPFAIFVDSAGSVSAAPWSPSEGSLAVEPPCTAALTLLFEDGGWADRRSVPCAEATLR